jgi:hypothetical protein
MSEPRNREKSARQANADNAPECLSEETHLAFTVVKLLGKILLPEEKDGLVKSCKRVWSSPLVCSRGRIDDGNLIECRRSSAG